METGPWPHLDRRQERGVVWGGRHRFLLEVPANFHEKAHFVKADVADPFVVERYDSVSFAMLASALLMSQLSSDPVHYEILLFGLLRRRCNLRNGLSSSRRVHQVRNLRSRLI